MSFADDRRRTPREPLLLKVEYGDAGELVGDYTDNISTGGTFVLTERPLPVGSEVRLTLSFPGLIKALPITGTVKWVREEPAGERGVGVAFDLGDHEAQARLAPLIERIAAARAGAPPPETATMGSAHNFSSARTVAMTCAPSRMGR